jgi:hypothetical protein
MKREGAINLGKAVFKSKTYPPLFLLLLCGFYPGVVIVTLLNINGMQISLFVVSFIAILFVYIILCFDYYTIWLLDDRIVYKYSFRLSGRVRTVLLNDVEFIEYRNKTGRHGPKSIAILRPKGNVDWKKYKVSFNDPRNTRVYIFLNIMYSRGFDIDISKCIREPLVLNQIKLGIQQGEKLLKDVHY